MRFHSIRLTCFAVLLGTVVSLSSGQAVMGQDDRALDLQMQMLRERLRLDTKLDQTQKENVQTIIGEIERVASSFAAKQNELRQLQSAIQSAEQRAVIFRSDYSKLKAQQPSAADSSLQNDDLIAAVSSTKAEVEELREQLKANEESSSSRIERRKQSRQNVDALSQKISELKTQLQQASNLDSDDLVSQAVVLKQQVDLALAEVEKEALLVEVQRDESEEQFSLLKQQHDLIELQVERKEAYLKDLEELYGSRLELKAKRRFESADAQQDSIKETTPLLLASYQVNTRLAKRAQEVEQEAIEAKAKADQLKGTVEILNKKFRETEVRVRALGLTGSVGAMLRKRRADLVETANLNIFYDDAKSQIDELQYGIFDIDQQREDLSEQQIRLEIEAENGPQTPETWEQLEQPINDVIEARKVQLTAVKNSLNRLFNHLIDVQQFDSNRRANATKFRDYINERILWIRSNDILFSKLGLDNSDKYVLSSGKWQEAGWHVIQALGLSGTEKLLDTRPDSVATSDASMPTKLRFSTGAYLRLPFTLLGSLVCFLLLLFKPRMRREVDRLGGDAARGTCVTFWPTAHSFFLTVLIAFAIPMIPLLIGMAIVNAPFHGSAMFYAIGRALLATGMFAIPVEILRRMSRPQGLANQHFAWPNSSIAKLKQNLDWVVLPGSLLVFAVGFLYSLDVTHRIDLPERILFCGGMLFGAYFLYQTFNAKNGVFSSYLRANERSWANQTSALWVGLILFIPVSLALLAFWGYYYTALNLAKCGYATLIFAMIVEIFRGLAQRFVLVRRRNAFIQAAKRKRQVQIEAQRQAHEDAQALADSLAAENGTRLSESTAAPVESLEIFAEIKPEEIEENVIQAYKLISLSLMLVWVIGLWMIWTDVLPALRTLDDYTLWPNEVVEKTLAPTIANAEVTTSETSKTVAPNGVSTAATTFAVDETSPTSNSRVTVRDLLLFIVIVTVTWIAATNLPNAFEVLFLEELPVDRSFRYAIKALTSYAIVILGVVFAFRALSIGWANVQWLVTALTFGLAFGLQEIFANFVAGIILMFERPMRIGDLITVDEFTGVVTKIRTRATTIVNWDRKEYVIPNKDFITGRLVNWTLSDAINRVELAVGIAYGSDVELAKNTLYDICKKHPKIVDDPATQVIFSEFGDSSLNLTLRCFIGDVDSRPQVMDSLHTQINSAFNELGIEISFPQRDLHLRSIDMAAGKAIEKTINGNS